MQLINLEISLANYMVALKLINGLSEQKLNEIQNVLKNKYLGIILIKTGEISEGINMLLTVINSSLVSKNELYLEIASAYIEKNNYSQADIICNEILKSEDASTEIIGRAQNLLGISNLYNKSDLNITLDYFQNAHKIYTQESNFSRIAGSEVNLGNIQNILGNYSKAEKHWNKALQLNQSIGNVEQEANVLLSTGVFNYEHSNYKKAVKAYQKGGNIFKGLGSKMNYGLISLNLGEVYLEICEYKKSFASFEIAKEIFMEFKNNDELIEVYFLLARLFIVVGNEEIVKEYLIEIENIKKEKTERERVLISFTKAIADYTFKNLGEVDNLTKIMENLFSINEKLIASDLLFIISIKLINSENYENAFSFLHHKKIIEISSFNKKYNAHRLYLLSKIPIKYQTDKSLTKNLLLLKALAITQSGSISDLSINILTDLIIFFKERGNIIKAEEYALLSKVIIQYIIHNNSGVLFKNLESEKYLASLNYIESILGKKEN
jgi:tetratricopeptide (TPR) repeat protein